MSPQKHEGRGGRTVTETNYRTLNQRGDTTAQSIIDAITKIANSKVA